MPDVISLPNGRKIGPGQPCFVVAEIGQNHQGDAYTALRLIGEAHKAGVDAVKFCKRHIPSDLTLEGRSTPYDNPHSFGETYGEHRAALELDISEYRHLIERMRYNEWPEIFFATACDIVSADELELHVNPPMYKIASRDLDNLPLIDHVAGFGKPVILSAGMMESDDVSRALGVVRRHHHQVMILYCVSEYPTPVEHIDLGVMQMMEARYHCPVGFSDHTAGIVAAQTAATLGVAMVEKHFTLARAMKGTDHAGSLEPEGMARLVRNIRIAEEIQQPLSSEVIYEKRDAVWKTRQKLGRSIVAARCIMEGERITEDMLTLKSPGSGLRWSERTKILGQLAVRLIPTDTMIQETDVALPEPAEAIDGSV
jgi:sialic acid synthase SpsE